MRAEPQRASYRPPGYGFGTHDLGLEAFEWDPRALSARVKATFASPTYTPPHLPTVALEVISLSQRPDVDTDDIARLVERDPVLAARLLKIANSSVYRRNGPSRTLHDSLLRLGVTMLRDLVMAETLSMKVFRTGGGYADSMEELRFHSMVTAHLARIVCHETSIDAEYAFLCGLLHDIGFAAILLAMGDVPRGQSPPGLEVLWPVAAEAHAAVGATVARLWNLPPDVILVLEQHGRARFDGRVHPLLAALLVAEHLAWSHGLGLMPKLPGGVVLMDVDPVDERESALARRALGIDDRALDRLTTAAENVVALVC